MAASTSSIQFSVYRLHSLIITYTLFVRHQLLAQIRQNAIHPHLKNMSSMAKKIIYFSNAIILYPNSMFFFFFFSMWISKTPKGNKSSRSIKCFEFYCLGGERMRVFICKCISLIIKNLLWQLAKYIFEKIFEALF